MKSPEASYWRKAIPVDVMDRELAIDDRFSLVTFLLLRCISSSRQALELFLSDPLLMPLILYNACDQRWTV